MEDRLRYSAGRRSLGKSSHGMGQLVRTFDTYGLDEPHPHASADYMQGTRVSFKSQEDAIHFAKKQGKVLYTYSNAG